MSDTDRELRVSKIRNGTVIDHLAAGQALNVLALLGIDGSGGESVSIGMNVPSDKLAKKDIVKVEDRELSQSEVDVLAVIAPRGDDQHRPGVRSRREEADRTPRIGRRRPLVSEPELHHQRRRTDPHALFGPRRRAPL